MSIDPKVQTAITEAVKYRQQTNELATCLIAWFDALSSATEDINDAESTAHRIDILLETTNLTLEDSRGEI